MEARIKSLKLIPADKKKFISNIRSKTVDDKYKEFVLSLLYTESYQENMDADAFYIDEPYKWNFYNYTQKFKYKEKLECHKKGWDLNSKETNYSNYDDILIKADKYIKYKNKVGYDSYNKVGYDSYYEKIESIFPWVVQDGKYLVVEYCKGEYVDPFAEDYREHIVSYLKEMYELGLWANNINWYSIRKSEDGTKIVTFDPELFFIIEYNKDIKNIKTFEEFIRKYYRFKLKSKIIHYKIKHNDLDESAMKYLYNSYWILENMAQAVREYVNE